MGLNTGRCRLKFRALPARVSLSLARNPTASRGISLARASSHLTRVTPRPPRHKWPSLPSRGFAAEAEALHGQDAQEADGADDCLDALVHFYRAAVDLGARPGVAAPRKQSRDGGGGNCGWCSTLSLDFVSGPLEATGMAETVSGATMEAAKILLDKMSRDAVTMALPGEGQLDSSASPQEMDQFILSSASLLTGRPVESIRQDAVTKIKVNRELDSQIPSWIVKILIDGVEVSPERIRVVGGHTEEQVRPYAEEIARLATVTHINAEMKKSTPVESDSDLVLGEKCMHAMQRTLKQAEREGLLPGEGSAPEHDEPPSPEVDRIRRWRQSREKAAERSLELKRLRGKAQGLKGKAVLPMNEAAGEVLEIVASNQYSIIIGETGSGKTTQVPQILLDAAIDEGVGANVNIICTQPRRIAATSVAARVAAERGPGLSSNVGHHVRHSAQLPKYGGSITYCTTGVLLRQLQVAPDDVMDGISHIVFDEVHERSIDLDFTLIIIKRAMAERVQAGKSCPKIILMSATVDTSIFKDYFHDARLGTLAGDCVVLRVPGRTFPVQRHYLEDVMTELAAAHAPAQLEPLLSHGERSDIAEELGLEPSGEDKKNRRKKQFRAEEDGEAERADESVAFPPLGLCLTLIAHIVKTTATGAILVFLPGFGEIEKLKQKLTNSRPLGVEFQDEKKFRIFQLHSLVEKDQRTVFDKVPSGVRKIVLATNIAETSITIPEVTAVVDTGTIRQMQYNPIMKRQELRTVFVSQSNLAQRAGRAGRVQAGHYYGLFSEDRISTLPQLPVAEMRLADLASLGLAIRAQREPFPIGDFLAEAVEPPAEAAVVAAVRDLTGIGAITEDERITHLGQLLARLPLHPSLGKLVVLGVIFQCLDPMIILGVASEVKPFIRATPETGEEANAARFRFADGSFSDHLMLLHAYNAMRAAARKTQFFSMDSWCRRHFLRPVAVRHIELAARQVEATLSEAGLISLFGTDASRQKKLRHAFGPPHLNVHSRDEAYISAVLAAGLSANMAWVRRQKQRKVLGYASPDIGLLGMPGSFSPMMPLGVATKRDVLPHLPVMLFESTFYSDVSRSTAMTAVTPISPLTVALFGHRPRAPTAEDLAYLEANKLPVGNLVVGAAPADARRSNRKVHRLSLMVRPDEEGGDGGEGERLPADEARDVLLRFRVGLEGMVDGTMRALRRGRSVNKDPARRLFVRGLVDVVAADGFRGPRLAMKRIAQRLLERKDTTKPKVAAASELYRIDGVTGSTSGRPAPKPAPLPGRKQWGDYKTPL